MTTEIMSVACGMFLVGLLCGILFANGLMKFIDREIHGGK
jgi:hypothetical protein